MQKIKSINWIFVFSIVLWCFVTLVRLFNHSPWYDEAHAWTIAQELNMIEIFRFMKTEGHTFLWYLFLMPFAKTNFAYPYSMLLLNWFFCLLSLIILWWKAPFNNLIKFLITFSFPFLALYSVIARCYAIGILFLFALISMDKEKLQYPNWYALFLVLLANTSLMGIVPATVLGIIFAVEMIKKKQKIALPFSIAIFGAVIILLQLFGCVESGLSIYSNNDTLFKALARSIQYNTFYYWIVISGISLISAIIFYVKNKIFPIFLACSLVLLSGIFCVYAGRIWHLFFIYIFFVASCWLMLQKENLCCKNLLNIALVIISVACMFYKPVVKDSDLVWRDNKMFLANEILKDENLNNSTILIFRQFDTTIQPYLVESNINLVNYCSGEKLNHNTMSYVNSKNCRLDMVLDSELIALDKDIFDKWYNENLYLLTLNKLKMSNDEEVSKKIGYKFVLYKDFGLNYLWKVEKIKDK